jgi:hypothetical protein
MSERQMLSVIPTRSQLASFLARQGADPQLIRAFELLFLDVVETIPSAIDDTDTGEVGSAAGLAVVSRMVASLAQLTAAQRVQIDALTKKVRDLELMVSRIELESLKRRVRQLETVVSTNLVN